MTHKDGCEFKDFYQSVTSINPNGPDSSLTVREDGLFYDSNLHDSTAKCVSVTFSFCPCCGVSYRD